MVHGFEHGCHGAGHSLGVEKVVVHGKAADRCAVLVDLFDQVFVATAQEIHEGGQQGNQVVGARVEGRVALIELFHVGLQFFQAFPVFRFR